MPAPAPTSSPRPDGPSRCARPRSIPGSTRSRASRGRSGAPIQAQPGGYQVNFNNADLAQVVQAVLGDLLHQPYTIDPRVTGTVTLSTQGPISPNDLIAMLETVLRATGAALVQDGRAGYRILPLGEAVSGRTVLQLGTDPKPLPAGYGITIIPLRNVSAETIGPLIAPATNPELVRIDPTRNLVLISGTSADRAALGATVQSFDVDWLRGMSSGIFPLQQAQPEAVIKELSAVFGGAPDRGPLKGLINFMPVERLNAVLVVSSRVDKLNEAGRWIRRLDQGDSDDERVYVYMVQNGTAANMARVLGQAFGKVDQAGASPFDDELGSDVARGLGQSNSSSTGIGGDQANAGTGGRPAPPARARRGSRARGPRRNSRRSTSTPSRRKATPRSSASPAPRPARRRCSSSTSWARSGWCRTGTRTRC